jgi:aquaporin Z
MTDTASTTIPTSSHKLAAEIVGTFVLVFFGVGTALATGGEVITTGLAFGLTVLVMAYSVGRISGGHFNPAVTVGAAVGGRLAWAQTGLYIGGQLVGGILGAFVLWIIWQGFPGFSSDGNFGQNAWGPDASGLSWWGAFVVEAVTTMIFLLVILAVTDERNEHPALAPLAIGLSLAMIHFATINLTGTSVNPARSISAAIFAGGHALAQLWLFILAPLLGGAAAGVVYATLFGRAGQPVPGSGLVFGRQVPGAVPGYGAPDAYQVQWNQEYEQGQPGQPGQAWPPEQPQQWQPQYPTGQPPQQGWPQQPTPPPSYPPTAYPPGQAPPPPQQWPGDDDKGQTQVRPPG